MTQSKSSHGTVTRGLEAGANPGIGYGRFGQMFALPPGAPLPDDCLRDIAAAMIKPDEGKPIDESETVDENPTIPAGYTYFGQFVDHDITLDPTPLSVQNVDVEALEDFRTPALDLDCVYGRGPDDQPYMYEKDGVSLRLAPGNPIGNAGATVGTLHDLLRLPDSQIALIGDKRNDENKIVSQIHGAIISLHNKIARNRALIERVGATFDDPTSRFRAAATITRWHYQYVVVHDFLARICEEGMVREVLNADGNMPYLPNYLKTDLKHAYMPVEFAGAAYRFGHSMVRPSYALNKVIGSETGPGKNRLPTFSRGPGFTNMNGFPGTLPPNWGIDWKFFLDGIAGDAGLLKIPQPSYRIDALLAEPLGDLPEFFKETGSSLLGNLAFRNLKRGQNLRLPSGQKVARALGIEPLADEDIWKAGSRLRNDATIDPDMSTDMKATDDKRKAVFDKWVASPGGPLKYNTPLWFYVLREAEWYGVNRNLGEPGVAFGGQHLGPVGSRIIAETFIGLLWLDTDSFLHSEPKFKPYAEITGGSELTLDRLIAYALTP